MEMVSQTAQRDFVLRLCIFLNRGAQRWPRLIAGRKITQGKCIFSSWSYADFVEFYFSFMGPDSCTSMCMALVTTAEVCDANSQLIASGDLRALQPIFQIYGRRQVFSGQIVTIKVFEDNVYIRELLEEKGNGRVLVVDGGGSLRCAILGGNPVVQAQNNGWAGIVVNGCIRDVDEINGCDIGVRALASHPMKANKKRTGEKHVPITIAGTRIRDGEWLYADTDGILVWEACIDVASVLASKRISANHEALKLELRILNQMSIYCSPRKPFNRWTDSKPLVSGRFNRKYKNVLQLLQLVYTMILLAVISFWAAKKLDKVRFNGEYGISKRGNFLLFPLVRVIGAWMKWRLLVK
ncbi:hypothetical protein G4B88_005180 [Cannabis sativa]|uniref:4-hydroxy-4-methyl-2-oxoglutarate aldolase n=1 Tax=Cannabis sativa TaxID=3483 RepID=A0A7J6EP64_CANSA|nr:hypothetical protein G4B88_005180 [Cannabis sativa]